MNTTFISHHPFVATQTPTYGFHSLHVGAQCSVAHHHDSYDMMHDDEPLHANPAATAAPINSVAASDTPLTPACASCMPLSLQIESAFKLFDDGSFLEAFPRLVQCHFEDPSNPEILHRLGYISCLMKNYKASFDFYHRAATKGQKASSYNNLGILYSRGLGVERCYDKAMQCYLKAFMLGDKGGAINIGNLFKRGCGVARNYSMAIYWYRNAKGHPGSNLSLGLMYHHGLGVERNMQKALQYFQQELNVSGRSETTMSFVDYAKCIIAREQCCIGRI